MRGSDDKIIKITFVFSLLTHCLFLGMPGFNLSKPQPKKPEEIPVQIEIEKPPLLPKIDIMGKEKKFSPEANPPLAEKEIVKEEELPEPESEPQPEEEEITQESEPKEQIEEETLKEEVIEESKPEPSKEIVKVKNPQKEAMLRYEDMIKQKIESCRRYPNWAKKQEIEGTDYLTFIVSSSGQAKDIKIVHSSGFDILDNEAVATIKRANPFPPIPEDLDCSCLNIEIAIVFELK